MAKKQKRKSRKSIPQSSIVSDDIYIPNHSGTHDAGTIHKTPVNDFDIPNKAYVDSVAGISNIEGGNSLSTFGGVINSPVDGGDST